MEFTRRLHFGIATLGAAALLAACHGHAGSSLPPVTTAAHRSGGSITFAIDAPSQSGTASSRHGVKPQYLSPATRSIKIAITGPTNVTETQNLSIGSNGCTSTLASVFCTLTVPGLTPCTPPTTNCYTATLTTYDETGGAGNVLSEAQAVMFGITAGVDNTISLTLSGVPASIVATLLPFGAGRVLVQALDADDDIIVGSGSPTFAMSKTSGSLSVTVSQAVTLPSDVFVVTPTSGGSATLTVTASYTDSTCSLSGAVCTATFTLSATQGPEDLFVANTSYWSGSPNTVTIYAPPYTGTPITLTEGVATPWKIKLDSVGNLYIENGAIPDSLTIYAPPYTGTPTIISTNVFGAPSALAVTLGGDVFVSDDQDVYAYSASNLNGTPLDITNGVYTPQEMVVDPAGDLFVADWPASDVTIYTAGNYSGTPLTVSNGVYAPYGLALDASGDLFVGDGGAGSVTEYTPPYTGAPAATMSGMSLVDSVALDSSNDVFAADYNDNDVEEFAPPYTGPPTVISNSVNIPQAVAVDSSGDVFVANCFSCNQDAGTDTVTEYTAGHYTSAPTATITNGVSGEQALTIGHSYALTLTPGN